MKNDFTEQEQRLARFAKAIGHPTRVAILKFLASQDCCFFGDIHEVLPIAKATVSQHLTELKNAGLIQGEIFPPKVRYCINPETWAVAKEMFNDLFIIGLAADKGLYVIVFVGYVLFLKKSYLCANNH